MAKRKKPFTPAQVERLLNHYLTNPGFGRGVQVPGITGGCRVKPGDKVRAHDGDRVILTADLSGIVYLHTKTGYVYSEDVATFGQAMTAVFYGEVYKRTKDLVPIIEAYMGFLMGVASAVSGVAFVVILTVDIAKFAHTHQKDFPKWFKIFNRNSAIS